MSKSRYWAFLVYPESAPEDWRKQLQLSGLRCAISPLHDKCINADEDEKKPHWHVIACWDGPTTYAAAKTLTDKLNAPIPQMLNSVKGYYRYFTHKDNPEKYQYDDADIQHLGGFDPADYIEWTRSELEAFKREIIGIIRDAGIFEYSDLLDILLDSDKLNLASVAANHTIFVKGYIDSRRNKLKDVMHSKTE
jgi:hypothetical protein